MIGMIDQAKKKALIEHIKRLETSREQEELLLPPSLYFDGYDEPECTIAANNIEPISTSRFLSRLQEIQQRPDVSAVFIRFYDYDDAEQSEDCWINSDSIYLVTTASLQDVKEWFRDFEVTDVWAEGDCSRFIGLPGISDGSRLVAVWWD